MQVILLAWGEGGQAEQFQGAQHAIQRCADLMAHGREEAALGLVGRVGGFAGRFQGGGIFDVPGYVMQRA